MRPQSQQQQHNYKPSRFSGRKSNRASQHEVVPTPLTASDPEETELYSFLDEEQRAERRRLIDARINAHIEAANAQASTWENSRRPRSGRPNLRLVEGDPESGARLSAKEDAKFQRIMKAGTQRRAVAPCHYHLLAATLLLTVLSIPLIYSASTPIALNVPGRDTNHFMIKQMIFAAVGLLLMIFASRVGPDKLRGFVWTLYGVAVAGLLATKFSPLGDTMGNVERWVKLGPVTFQFSELLKIALIGVMADFWSRAMRDPKLRGTWLPWLATSGLAGIPIGLVFIQPHLSAVLVLCALPLAIAVYAGASWRQLAALGGGVAVLGILAVAMCGSHSLPLLKPYQQDRIYGHFFKSGKEADRSENFQANMGVTAIGRGGLLGVGPGASVLKNGHLPAPHTDFIYAVIGEEWGLIGTLGLIGIYGVIVFFCFQIGHTAPDSFSALICAGVGTLIAIQALGNMAVVTKLMPVTGIPLPIISYGGSGLWCALLGIGLVLAVSRTHGEA